MIKRGEGMLCALVRVLRGNAHLGVGTAMLLVGCSAERTSQEGSEALGQQAAALTQEAGFEDASVWTVITGSADVVDGGTSLRLSNIGGYVELQNSDPYGTLTTDGAVRLSVNIPDLPWGHAALYFDLPSQGIYRQYVGPVDLTSLPAGENELTFNLPGHIQTALAGSYSDFKLGIAFAVPSGTTITLRDVCFSSCDAPEPEPMSWTSRDMWHLRNIGWSSHRNLSGSELQAVFEARRDAGMIPLNIGGKRKGFDVEYSIVWRDNVDGRGWRVHWGLTSDEYHEHWEQYRDEGLRPLTVTSYEGDDSQLFAGIWIENRENLGWASYRGMTGGQYADWFEEYRAKGYRPIDIEAYETDSGLRYATVWYENVDNVAWAQLRNMPRDEYQREVDERSDAGYLPIDYDAYDDEELHAAIWERPAQRPAHWLRTKREDPDFANLWRQYLDEGYRPFHIENHGDSSDDHFAGIWIQNDDRYHYQRKGDIDSATRAYRSSNDLPGISVAVIRAGDVLYRRGFGWADVDGEKVAHGQTVYNAASVSKLFGGTLAAKLEDEGVLRDGTPLSLDMTLSTSTYLTNMPAHHTHTVEQLTAHLGCVPHYDTSPDIDNQTTHYTTARAAVQSIWNVGRVNGCTVGSTRSYSTPAFTFLGAVLEQVSGRSIQDLIRTELAEPYGLSSLRAQWQWPFLLFLPPSYDRAVPYDDDNDEDSYEDSSWKVLGGGLEMDTVDLARFGALVLYGQIVSPAVRDNRLFSAVSPGCGDDTGGICNNGVAWTRGADSSGRRVMEHGGSWVGARAFLRVYPDDDLVVAIMSNRTEHSPDIDTLGTSIGDIVLAP